MPNLPVTVPRDLYDQISGACGEPFAESYLSGAELHQSILLPRTHKAWERLTESWAAKDVLRFLKITLREPPHFNAAQNVQMGRAA